MKKLLLSILVIALFILPVFAFPSGGGNPSTPQRIRITPNPNVKVNYEIKYPGCTFQIDYLGIKLVNNDTVMRTTWSVVTTLQPSTPSGFQPQSTSIANEKPPYWKKITVTYKTPIGTPTPTGSITIVFTYLFYQKYPMVKIKVAISNTGPASSTSYTFSFITYTEDRQGHKMGMHMRSTKHMVMGKHGYFSWYDMVEHGLNPSVNATTTTVNGALSVSLKVSGSTLTIDPVVGVYTGSTSYSINGTALTYSYTTYDMSGTATASSTSPLTISVSIVPPIEFQAGVSGTLLAEAKASDFPTISNVIGVGITTERIDTGWIIAGKLWGNISINGVLHSALIDTLGTHWINLTQPGTLDGIVIDMLPGTVNNVVSPVVEVDTVVQLKIATPLTPTANITEYYNITSPSNATYSYLISIPWINTTATPLLGMPKYNLTVPAGYDLVALDNSTGAILGYTIYNSNGINKTYEFTINNTVAPLKFWVNFTAWNSVTLLNTTNGYQYFNPGSNINLTSRLIDPYQNPINGTNITYIVYINGTKSNEFNITTDTYGWGNTTLTLPNTPNTRIDIETLYNGSYLGLKNITLYTTGVNIYTNISSLPSILIPGHTYIITGNASLTVNGYTVPLMINGSGQIYYYSPTPGGYKNITFTLWSYYQGVNVTKTVTITRLVGDMIGSLDVMFNAYGTPVITYRLKYTGLTGKFLYFNETSNGTIAYSPNITWIMNQTAKLNIYTKQAWLGNIRAWADNHTMSITVDQLTKKITIVVNGPCTLKIWTGSLGKPRQVIYDYKVWSNWTYDPITHVLTIPINGTIVILDYSSLTSSGGGGGGVVGAINNPVPEPHELNPVIPQPSTPKGTFLTGLAIIFLSVIGIGLYHEVSKRRKISYLWSIKVTKARKKKLKWKEKRKWWD